MPRFERLRGAGIEQVIAEELRRKALHHYLRLARLRAQKTGESVVEVIESDLGHKKKDKTNGHPRRLFAPMRSEENITAPEATVSSYVFSVPDIGNLTYYPQRHMASSPLLPEGTLVHLSPLVGFLLEVFMVNPAVVISMDKLTSLIQKRFAEAPIPEKSDRVRVAIHRLRKKLGDAAPFSLIHTIGNGYSLVPNSLAMRQSI